MYACILKNEGICWYIVYASRVCKERVIKVHISQSVKYLSDRKHVCPMDPSDPVDHLTSQSLSFTSPRDNLAREPAGEKKLMTSLPHW